MLKLNSPLVWWAVPILSSDMLEGLLQHTNMVQREVVQWGTEQEVVVQWGTEQVVVVLQEDKGPGVAEGRTWDRGLGVAEGRMWDRGLGVAEDRTWGTGGQYIVQSGRQLLVAYFEEGLDSNSGVFDPWVAVRDRLYFVYLT